MIDLSKALVKTKQVDRDTIATKILYDFKYDKFYVLIDKVRYEVNAYDFNRYKTVYSKPVNKKQEPWTKRTVTLNPDNYSTIGLWWSTYKHNQKVRGVISGKIFIVTKFN